MMNFSDLLAFYNDHLMNEVMPFWLKYSIDDAHGGINNIIADDGRVLSTDKFLWSQGRAIWTFSGLFNYIDGDEKWIDIARPIVDFVVKNGRTDDGKWNFKLHADGSVAEHPKSIYVDAFIAYGMTEFFRATGERDAIDLAVDIYGRTTDLLDDHANLPTEPHPIPEGLQSHGPLMIFAHVYHELGLATGNREILERALKLADRIMKEHVKPERRMLYELVRPGGELADTDAGNTFLPGHSIESMWFLERIYDHWGRKDMVKMAMEVIRWNLESGWDDEFGGLYLARHAKGGEPVWHQPDAKVWWPHTEALYALLRAYEVTGEDWCMDWYWKVHEYSFNRFPDAEHGDWHQNLDRRGNVIEPVIKNLAVKDPFHLPRALILSILVLRRLTGSSCPQG
ncbi:MAG: AGE family epimerase/isomerase, partial [Theionarchaea archaeon]|nr:AGE family epimerase/isomerase [Theionarchaea archaeon]